MEVGTDRLFRVQISRIEVHLPPHFPRFVAFTGAPSDTVPRPA